MTSAAWPLRQSIGPSPPASSRKVPSRTPRARDSLTSGAIEGLSRPDSMAAISSSLTPLRAANSLSVSLCSVRK